MILALACSFEVMAQSENTDCTNALYEANNSYKKGQLNAVIDRLENCLPSMSKGEERFETIRLLALSYHALNNEQKAKEYMAMMLKAEPRYNDVPHDDPLSFSRVIAQINSTPVTYLGFSLGVNYNSPQILKSFRTLPAEQVYKVGQGYNIGAFTEYKFSDALSLQSGLAIAGTSVIHVLNGEGWNKTYNESIQSTNLQLGLRYGLPINDLLSVRSGSQLGLSVLNYSRVNIENENTVSGALQTLTNQSLESHNRTLPYVGLQLGLNADLDKGSFELSTTYDWYLLKTIDSDHRFDNQDFIFDSNYVQDDLRFRLWSVNLSFRWPIHYKISL